MDKVTDGYIMFIDDDDYYLHKNVFEIINLFISKYDLVIWKFLRPDKLIYPKKDSEMEVGCIDTSSVCFHFSLKNKSRWIDNKNSDFTFYNKLFKFCSKKIVINFTFTATQYNNRISNYGEKYETKIDVEIQA